MAEKKSSARVTRNLTLTRAAKILALVPTKNACSDDSSTSDEDTNVYIAPPPDTSDAPSIASSLEALNKLNSSTVSTKEEVDISIGLPLTPILSEIFPSPSTSNYNIIPTLNSIQSISSPSVEQPSPQPSTSLQQQPLTRYKRIKTTKNVEVKKVKIKKFVLNYHWSKSVFRHSACPEENLYDLHQTDIETALDYKVDVECPQIVKHYNKHMGGVDLADMLISLYRTPFKSHRWYLGIFSQAMCINNAWLLHRRDGKNKSLKDFRYELFEGLSKSDKIVNNKNVTEDIGEDLKFHKPISIRPTDSVRFDDKGHLPEAGDETMRYKY